MTSTACSLANVNKPAIKAAETVKISKNVRGWRSFRTLKMLLKERIHMFYLIHDLAPFGAQRVALYTVRGLDKSRFSVTVCSFWGDETLAPEFEAYGAEVIPLRAGRFLDLSAWLRLARLLFRSKPDIVQTNLPELSIPVRLLSLFLPGISVAHTVQNPFLSEPWYWRFLNRVTLGLSDVVIFSSHGIYEEAALNSKRLTDKLFVVQNGISMEVSSAADSIALRKELRINKNEKVIGCVARLTRQKGQDILIDAAAKLLSGKRCLRFILAGDGEELPALQALAWRLGVEREVMFLGRRADIGRILSACDMSVAPSRWEGMNIALGEAMLSGVPCVGTAISGHADILKDGITGITVPPEDSSALAAGIERMLDNPEAAHKLAAAARELIRTEFTVEGMAKKYQKIYLDLAAR